MLNHAQQAAVRVDGHCLITACPGSGKTTVLKHRAAFLLRGNPASNLVGVTFTSDAASELEERIRAEIPKAGDRVTCGTFHSLCKLQLERSGLKFSIVDEEQQGRLIRRACLESVDPGEAGYDFESAKVFIDNIKCQVDPILPSPASEPLVGVYEVYQKLLRQMGAFDFADLMVEAVRGMTNGTVEPFRCTYLLADEFQDTDEVQLAWVMAHARQGVQVTVVGDDDQSIYGWRAALGFEGLERFRHSTQATHVALNVTYRCAREIVTPAARLITCNTERVEKVLDTVNRTQGQVRIRRCSTSEEEIDRLTAEILRSGNESEWGVLARTNAQLDAIENVLSSESIKYVRAGGRSLWDARGPSVFLGVCQSLAQGNMIGVDELMRCIGVGEQRLEGLHSAYNSKSAGSLQRFLNDQRNLGKKDHVEALRLRLREWQQQLRGGEDKLALGNIATFIRTRAKLYDKARSSKDQAKDFVMMEQCVNSLSRLKGGLASRMVALRQSEKRPDKNAEGVRLMTLHSSKGLEFERVWIVGCVQGTLPSSKSPIPEERRLFYVGMTRAKRDLTLSYVINDKTPPSMFLAEAGLM
jgi:DNA helicase-2/ATP-dependent DNA helicase PcrA